MMELVFYELKIILGKDENTDSILYFSHNVLILNPFPNKPWFLLVSSTSVLENTVDKGEIARNEQFLLFPQCFQATCLENCRLYEPFPPYILILTH